MKTYRRIEVNAFRRRMTIVSGEWRPRDWFEAEAAQTHDGVSLNDSDASEPVAPDSPEGQLIISEAVRTLERRLTPQTRAAMLIAQDARTSNGKNGNSLPLKLQSFYQLICPKLRALLGRRNKNV
jgi:hypothetical protein